MNEQVHDQVEAIIQGRNVRIINLDELLEIDRVLRTKYHPKVVKAYVVIFLPTARHAIVTYDLISKSRIEVIDTRLFGGFTAKEIKSRLPDAEVVGNIRRPLVVGCSRLLEERIQSLIAFIIFIVFAGLFFIFSTPAVATYSNYLNDPESYAPVENFVNFYSTIGQALITVMTLFITVFVLFTLTQNTETSSDKHLFSEGLFHKYMRDDSYITFVSGLSLLAASIGLLLNAAPAELFTAEIEGVSINKLNTLIPILFGFSISTLYISLFSLRYYARRVLLIQETNLVDELLKDREQRGNELRAKLDPSLIKLNNPNIEDNKAEPD